MEETEAKQVYLDTRSKEIIAKVENIHRHSLINMGLRLVEKTNYFKTLTGENKSEELESILSLDDLGSIDKPIVANTAAKPQEPPKKKAVSWEAFDL